MVDMEDTRTYMRKRIAEAAREVCERDGAQNATVKAIAEEADITRELFYYYFDNRDDAIEQMLEDYIDECVDNARLWNEGLEARESNFEFFAPLFRMVFYDNQGERRAMHQVLLDLGRFGDVKVRTVQRVVEYMEGIGFFRDYKPPEGASTRRMIAFAMYGCFGLLQSDPSISDQELAAICMSFFGVEQSGSRPDAQVRLHRNTLV